MASRIKGITIEIGGDTTKLDKALKDTDVNLSRVQKNLRDVERHLKLDPTNVDLLAQKQRLLAERAELAAQRVATLEDAAGKLDSTIEKSRLDDFNLELDLTKARAAEAARELKDFEPALDQVNDSAEDAADSLEDVDSSAGGMKEGFTIAGGAIAEFAGGAMLKLVDVALDAAEALWNLDEATEEYRESMALLNTAYENAGFSQEIANEAYRGFFEILGETDQATEASQLLAQLATNEEDVAKWVEIAAGAYGSFGDALPIESLIEAANETAKTGEVTGALADALNWVGISEEEVNNQLSMLGDETDRAQYLMDLLSTTYSDAADNFYKNNEAIIEARNTQAELDESTAILGQSVADLKTKFMEAFGPYIVEIINGVAAAIEFITPLIDGIAFAIGIVVDAIETLVGWIQTAVEWFLELIGVSSGSKSTASDVRMPGEFNRPGSGFSRSIEDSVPHYATGAIIPPNNPFLAVLGDNRTEPEIVAPYSAIKQATSDAIAERGGSAPATIIVRAADGFTRHLSFALSEESTRRGVSLVNE